MGRISSRTIVIIQGHPDPAGGHLCHALADSYAEGAETAGHKVVRIELSRLDFPLLRSQKDWVEGQTPENLRLAQSDLLAADHILLIYPLWLGTMPALLKGFLEQVLRPSLVTDGGREAALSEFTKLLKGTSCRIAVTMGMPAFAYRYFFFAHSLKSLERNILKFTGIGPIRESLFGMVEGVSDKKRQAWLDTMKELGAKGT